MAGASITPTRTDKDINKVRKAEVVVVLDCVSDDTTGLVPNQTLTGLKEYILKTVQPIPDATAPATSAFEIRIDDANGEPLFKSGSIAVDSKTPLAGYETLGWYPDMGESATFKLVDPADSVSTINIGTEKELQVILVFTIK